MKKYILMSVLFTSSAFAQLPPGFTEQNMTDMEKNMQSMMAGMQKMQQCMSNVDESKMEAVGQRAEKIGEEISELCKKGDRSAAQKKAIKFSKELKNNTEFKKMQKCMGNMGGMMKSMPFQEMFDDMNSGNNDVCTQVK